MSDTLVTLSAGALPAEKASFGEPTHTAIGDVSTGANVATFTATTNQQWRLAEFTVSFGATTTAASTLTVKSDTTVLYQILFPTMTDPRPIQILFTKRPLRAAIGKALTVNLSSPGSIASTISASGYLVAAP